MDTQRTPITVEDLYSLGSLEDVRISPDGQSIVSVQVTIDKRENRYHRRLLLTSVATGHSRRFTHGLFDYQPRWNPDGQSLVFVSRRDDPHGQLYRLQLAGGEAQQLTAMPNGASDPVWSPDGRQIAFLAPVSEEERAREHDEPSPAPATAWDAQRAGEQRRHEEDQRIDPRVITRLPYRSDASFFDHRRRHVYVIDVPLDDVEQLPRPRRLTDGDIHFGSPTWMPDGQSLLTTATRDPEADSLFAFYDVLRLPLSGAQPIILTKPGFSYFDPQPSPDGRMIAFLCLDEQKLLADGNRVAIIPAEGGEPEDLTAHTDLNVEQFRWQSDSQGIIFTANWRGDQHLYSLGLPGTPTYRNRITLVPGLRMVNGFDVARDGTIAFLASSPAHPGELFLRLLDGTERQLTTLNQAYLDQRIVVPLHEILYLAPDGQEVQGWALYPPAWQPDHPHPMIVSIHGGPHTMWGPAFRSMWHEWQTMAAAGYVVFFCNPRGSEGYGEQWRDAIRGNWGYADAPDIEAGVDAMLSRGGVDPARIAVTGGSYGGYMTAWLLAHTDRFVCGVAARGVYNLISHPSTSDAHELIEIEFNGYPWEMAEELWVHSPLAHAHKIVAPLLLLHSECDYRVPISEAEQLFSFLRRQKKVVELVRYPREGHELTRTGEPAHRVDHMRRTLAWFDRYC
ncbi:S9 family peptidase [Candidatus Chloroploca sp. Khr17]|uniref:S9 family peptidase n=1 Tax=Candidatus Chloroploca sp. Khr17 TaxID=2496869 RepID=UPI001F0F4469|nr:S9 family peptidase [Candidatus Chloroploca sp. Khr17]